MGKLHETLAVEPELKNAAESILAETRATFTKKQDHFEGQLRTYRPLIEGGESFPQEGKQHDTTVADKLEHTEGFMARLIDLVLQKETANTLAKADLEVDGKVLACGVPATVLLSLETRLKTLREMYREIPTLDPGEEWLPDPQRKNCFKAPGKVTYRTVKVPKAFELAKATDKHAAQVQLMNEDIRAGEWTTLRWSGKISPIAKSDLLARVDKLIAAVKKARCRANDIEVQDARIGEALFAYIHGS